MLYYILANCFSALSNVLNKYFIVNNYYYSWVRMIDVTFHANIINFVVFSIFFLVYKKRTNMEFPILKNVFSKQEFFQIILFSIPMYASAFKINMLQQMPIPYVEISSMVKPFLVWLLALILLHEKFYSYYLIYVFIALVGFLVANFTRIFDSSYVAHDGDLQLIMVYLVIGSIGDITRRYYCRKWDNAVEAIFIEMMIYGLYGFIYLAIFNKFSLSLFFSPYTITYAMFALLHHTCIIHGVKKATSVAALELLNFSKNIFGFVFSVVLLHDELTKLQITGAVIIAVALYLFNVHRNIVDKKASNNYMKNI